MASNDLFWCLSPLFWFLRATGATPFHHKNSINGILDFRWCHPQTFWFTFVTLVHLGFIAAQIFGGCFLLGMGIDKDQRLPIPSPTARYTNAISQTRFLVDSFLIPKLVHFNLASFQAILERLNDVDRWIPSSAVRQVRKNIIIVISIATLWHLGIWIMAASSIIGNSEPGWMIALRLLDSLMHTIGQLHSNSLVIQFASMCLMIGLRYAGLVDILLETVSTERSLNLLFGGWTDLQTQDGTKSDVSKSSIRNRIIPDNNDSSISDNDQPISMLDRLRCKPVAWRLTFLKTIYLTLSQAVLNHFNHVFEFTLLCYLVSKLISTSINCHQLITQLLNQGFDGFYWFFVNLPDIFGIFITFQSADYIRKKVKKFFSLSGQISTRNFSMAEHSELQTFLLQVRGEPIELSVCGLFKLGKQLLPAVAGTIATYILVLLQFNAETKKSVGV